MKRTSLTVLLALITAAALWVYQVSDAQSSGTTGPLKTGVVNVAEVLTKCQENLDREKEGAEKQRKVKAELEKLAGESDEIKQELQTALEPGSKEFMTRRKQWFNKEAELQALKEYQKEALTIESQIWTRELYEKLLAEVARTARQEGISMVLNKDESPLKGRNLTELFNLILSRQMLYNAPTLDMTAQVLENMDSTYDRKKTGK